MTRPDLQVDSDSRGLLRRAFQFRLRHLFFLTTGIAAICGLVRWLEWESLFYLPLACAPIVTLGVLTRANGDNCLRALRIGAALPAAVFAIGSVLMLMVAAYGVRPALPLMPNLVLAPLLFGLFGGLLGVLVSLPFVGLWYSVRSVRRTFFGPPDLPVEKNADPTS